MRICRLVVMYAAIAATGFFLSGCGGGSGPRLYSVSGTLKVKGAPLPNIKVQLFPVEGSNKAGIIASGVTDSSGKFYVSSPSGAGAAEGTYKVVLAIAGPTNESQANQSAAERAEMIKRIEEASKKKKAGVKQSSGPSPEAIRNAAANPGGMDAIRREMESRAKGRVGDMDAAVAAKGKSAIPFPEDYSNAATSPKEVEVKSQSLKIELDL